jgi:hypothetical protein
MKENIFEYNSKVGVYYCSNLYLYSAKPGNLGAYRITATCPWDLLLNRG